MYLLLCTRYEDVSVLSLDTCRHSSFCHADPFTFASTLSLTKYQTQQIQQTPRHQQNIKMNISTSGLRFSRLPTMAVLLALASLAACRAQNATFHQGCDGQDVLCRIVKHIATHEVSDARQPFESSHFYECVQGSRSYRITLPQSFIDDHPTLDQAPNTYVSIPHGCINGSTVTYPSNTTISVLPMDQRRHLAPDDSFMPTEGNVTMLFVSVRERNAGFDPPHQDTIEHLFSDRPGSVVRQMYDCSFGKYNIRPAEGSGIVNGYLKVNVPHSIQGWSVFDVMNDRVLPVLEAYGGEAAYDHVVFCIPQGTLFYGREDWTAYAWVNAGRSVYNGQRCGSMTITMHELGHNLGLDHANRYYEYADTTGVMGYGDKTVFGPRSCFNAHKNWHLGWYSDKSLDLSNSIHERAWGGRLVPFVDYDKTFLETDAVVVRIGTLYVQYNRARGFNDGTRLLSNYAVIVSAPDEPLIAQSELLSGVIKNGYKPRYLLTYDSYTFQNFNGTGHNLIFQVCDQYPTCLATSTSCEYNGSQFEPDYIHLSIHLDDGIQTSMCSVPLGAITDAPSSSPTTSMKPTASVAPSSLPTLSSVPSSSPSQVPTTVPSSSPTQIPSSSPSDQPSEAPTTSKVPTSSPSDQPSAAPTINCIGKDYQGLVPVNHRFGNQTCAWIANRKVWRTYLCQEGFEAFEQCQETCDSCNLQSEEPSDDGCEDSNKMFYVNQHLPNIRCFWLNRFMERSPLWRDRICAPGQPAYDHCPETCGKCTDTCEDAPNNRLFWINIRNGYQNCEWLSTRPLWRAKACRKNHSAYYACKEICNSCGN